MAETGNRHLLEWGSVIAAVVVIAAGALYYHRFYKPVPRIEKTDVPVSTLPDRFPADIPLPSNAGITENYTVETPGAPFQATRAFTTRASIAEGFAPYEAFFKTAGWETVHTATADSYRTLVARNDLLRLQATVFVSQTAESTERSVSITVTALRETTTN